MLTENNAYGYSTQCSQEGNKMFGMTLVFNWTNNCTCDKTCTQL